MSVICAVDDDDSHPKGPDICLCCVDVVIQGLGCHPPGSESLMFSSWTMFGFDQVLSSPKSWVIMSTAMTIIMIMIAVTTIMITITMVIMAIRIITWWEACPRFSSRRCCSPSRLGWTQSQPPVIIIYDDRDEDDDHGDNDYIQGVFFNWPPLKSTKKLI